MSNFQRETLRQVAEQLLSMANDGKLDFNLKKIFYFKEDETAVITEFFSFFDLAFAHSLRL